MRGGHGSARGRSSKGRGRGAHYDGGSAHGSAKLGLVRQNEFVKRHRLSSQTKGSKEKGKGKSKGKGNGRETQACKEDEVSEIADDGFLRHQQLSQAHSGAITAICIAHDAVYTASRDQTLKRWKPQQDSSGVFHMNAELLVPLGGACWSMVQIGDWLFCGFDDGKIRGFSKVGKDVIYPGHSQGISAMVVHQNILITGSAEGAVRCWQLNEQQGTLESRHLVDDCIPGQVRCLAAMGGQLWVGGTDGVTVVDLVTLNRSVQLDPRKKVSGLLEFQSHMISSYSDGTVCIFDGDGKVQHTQPPSPGGNVLCMIGLESGPRVLLGHTKGQLSSIALPSFELQASWQAFEGCPVRCLCAALYDGIFIAGGEDGTLQLWQRRNDFNPRFVSQNSTSNTVKPLETVDGAPRCSRGHLCISSSEAGVWQCSICNARKKEDRWFCGKCQECFCFVCFPMYIKGERVSAGSVDRSEAEQVRGTWCEVRKHSGMGCAVVTFKDLTHRQQVLEKVAVHPLVLGGIRVDLKPHMEKKGDGSSREVPSCAFAGWKQPKQPGACKLLARTLQVHLDRFCEKLCPVISLDE